MVTPSLDVLLLWRLTLLQLLLGLFPSEVGGGAGGAGRPVGAGGGDVGDVGDVGVVGVGGIAVTADLLVVCFWIVWL